MPKVLSLAVLLLLFTSFASAATSAPCAHFSYNITPSMVAPDGPTTLTGALTNCSTAAHSYRVVFKVVGPNNLVFFHFQSFFMRAGKTLSESITDAAPDTKGEYFVTIKVLSATGTLLAGPETKSFTVE